MVNDIDPAAANRIAADMTQRGFSAVASVGDVTKAADVGRLVKEARSFGGDIWLLVNNAGAFYASATVDFPEAEWDHAMALDAKAAFLCSREVLPGMISRGEGRIVVISSIAGHIVRAGQIAYCAAKAAAIHFSRCLAVEIAPHGITVNCICPGMTDSAMLRQTAESRWLSIDDYLAMIPAGRFASPHDHARMIAYLASEEASHVTGQVIDIDGGRRCSIRSRSPRECRKSTNTSKRGLVGSPDSRTGCLQR